MSRGDRREAIFCDDPDRFEFLRALGQACGKTGWQVHAYCLMSNHFHLVVETPEANLVAGMKWLQNTYTRRHNCRHRLWGRLFGDRFATVACNCSTLRRSLRNSLSNIAFTASYRELPCVENKE